MDDQPTIDDLAPADASKRPPGRGALVGIGLLVVLALAAGIVLVTRTNDDDGTAAGPPRLALSLGSSTFEAAGAMADMAMMAEIEYRLVGDLPDLGSEAEVYRVRTPAVDADAVARLAAALDVDGTPRRDGDGWIVGGDPDTREGRSLSVWAGPGSAGAQVSLYETYQVAVSTPAYDPDAPTTDGGTSSGGPVTTVPGEIDVEPPAPVDLPSADEAEALVRDLLAGAGLLDGEWEAEVYDSAAMGAAVTCEVDPDGVCVEVEAPEPVITERSVTLRRIVDGRVASGLEWYASVGDGGRIQSLSGTWAELEAIGPYPLRSTQDAFDALVAGEAWMAGGGFATMDAAATVGSAVSATGTGDAIVDEPATRPYGGGDDPVEGSGGGTSGSSGSADCTPEECGVEGPGVPTTFLPDDEPDDEIVCTEAPCDDPGAVDGNPGTGETDGDVVCTEAPCDDVTLPAPDLPPVPDEIPVTVVEVRTARLGAAVQYGVEGGADVAYLVPTYDFVGNWPDSDEGVVASVIALDPSVVEEPVVDDSTGATEPGVIEPGVIEPQPAPDPAPAEPSTTTTWAESGGELEPAPPAPVDPPGTVVCVTDPCP